MKIIVATANTDKLREIRKILGRPGHSLYSLADLPVSFRIIENGATFEANAAKKALAVSRRYPHEYVLGEDSGLNVDALAGAPGVRSKRYAGPRGDSKKNNAKLLSALKGVRPSERGAAFVCALALARQGKLRRLFLGVLRGRIALEACGTGGFGYDPVFYLPRYRRTLAQLSLREKNKISHRFRAFRKLKAFFRSNPL